MPYKCKLCGRDKFQKPSPHRCGNMFLKHYGKKSYKEKYNGSIFQIKNNLGFSVLG